LRLFVGDDWAEDHHDVEVMDGTGRRLAKARLPEGVAGMARLHAIVGELVGDDADEVEVLVGIETDRGPWVRALVAAGYTVLAVNPLQAARFRDRLGVSGAKSDAGDAHVLADMARTHAHELRPVAGDSAQADAVKVVARTHKTLIWERTRHTQRCGTRCGTISPPRWSRSRTWTLLTPCNCWPRPRPRPRPPG
jgi:transposase